MKRKLTKYEVILREFYYLSQPIKEDLSSYMYKLIRTVCVLMNMKHGIITRKEGEELVVKASLNVPKNFIRYAYKGTLCGKVIEKKLPIFSGKLKDEEKKHPIAGHFKFNSYIGAPLIPNDEVIGTLSLFSPNERSFSPRDTELLTIFAKRISSEIERKELIDELEKKSKELEIANIALLKHATNLEEEIGFLKNALKIEPVSESIGGKQKYELDTGSTYIIKEEKPEKSFEIFLDYITHGISGLCITRTFPGKIREKYRIMKVPIVWLSTKEPVERTDVMVDKPEHYVQPSSIAHVTVIISDFLSKCDKGIILIDGLSYLISNYGYDIVLRMVQHLNEKIVT
ncbi:MAG: DUF835 domain-containing protein, partial [Candidatus Thermoplasmatota archaeon]